MAMSQRIVRMICAFIALDVFLLDRWTKWLVVQHIAPYESITIVPGFFKLIHTQNPGAAFSFLANAPGNLRCAFLVGFSSLALAVVLFLLWRGSQVFNWTIFAYSLIIGGALGNLWDRVLKCHVTDFLLVYYRSYEWPAFNVADSAISVGATILVIQIVFGKSLFAPKKS